MDVAEIDAMEAGRELDALIWQLLNGKEPNLLMCRWTGEEYQPHVGYPVGHVSPPEYSTAVTAGTWQVVEWLANHGIVSVSNGDGDSCDCDFTPDGRDEILYGRKLQPAYVTADTWPLAICRAALRAVAGEREAG